MTGLIRIFMSLREVLFIESNLIIEPKKLTCFSNGDENVHFTKFSILELIVYMRNIRVFCMLQGTCLDAYILTQK